MSFTINDDVTLTSSASIDNIRISGNTIYSTNTDGKIVLLPNGNGNVGIGTSSPAANLDVGGLIKTDHLSLGIHQYPNVGGQWLTINLNTYNGNAGPNAPGPEGGIMFSNIDGNSIFKWGYYMGVVKPSTSDQSNSQRLDIGRTNDVESQISGGTTAPAGTFIPSVTVFNDNVGIGTSSPAAKLDIGGNTDGQVQAILTRGFDTNFQLQAINESSSNNTDDIVSKFGLRHGTNDTAMFNFYRGGSQADGSLAIITNNQERMRINSSGNVGIGTSSPAAKLDIGGNTDGQVQAILTRGLNTTFQLQAISESSSNNTGDIVSKFGLRHETDETALFNFIRGDGASDGSLAIVTNNTERMRISSNGNVGIGTSSPNSRLTINSGSTSHSGSEISYHGLAVTTGTSYQTIWMGYDGSTDIGYINAAKTGSSVPICLQTRGSYVGIGTTSPNAKLDIGGNTDGQVQAILTRGFDTNFQLQAINESSSNNTDDIVSKFGLRHGTNDTAMFNFIRGSGASDGSLAIVTNNAEHMRINSSGNVGIGTTTPAAKLDVYKVYNGQPVGTTAALIGGIDGGIGWSGVKILEKGNSLLNNDTYVLNAVVNASSKFVVTGAGNVGIGTSSPETKLDVAGTLRHQGLTLNEGTTPNVDEVKTFNLNVSYNTTTWTDVGITTTDLATGSYIIQLYLDSGSSYIASRSTYYTGFMSWYGSTNIYGDPATYNEILLHHSGRSQWNGSVFYLRTYRDGTAGTMSLQIKNATRTFTNVPMTFKFRRMI